MGVSAPARQSLNCDNCHRTRFYAYRLPSGRIVLVCYSCGMPKEVEQQPS